MGFESVKSEKWALVRNVSFVVPSGVGESPGGSWVRNGEKWGLKVLAWVGFGCLTLPLAAPASSTLSDGKSSFSSVCCHNELCSIHVSIVSSNSKLHTPLLSTGLTVALM